MQMPGEPSAVTRTGPEVIKPLVEAVQQQADLLLDGGSGLLDDPLSYAWLCCLEAAIRVGRVLDVQRTEAHATAAEELQEALSAARGAAATVRFALFGWK
jgi:hypothetical protein